MKSLYGSITRSAVIFLSYVTAMQLPPFRRTEKISRPGPPPCDWCAAWRCMRAARSAATDCSARLGPNLSPDPVCLPTPFVSPFVFHLYTFHDAEVALRAGAECLKRL